MHSKRFEGSLAKRYWLGPIAVALLLLIPFGGGFWAPTAPMDEGMALVYSELLLKGQLPYRDFETFYGPANIGVLASAYSFFGTSVFTERAVGLVYRLFILAAIFRLMRRWGTLLATGSLFLAGFLLVSTGLVAYAWMGAVACALWSIFVASRQDSTKHCFLAGLLAGGALLFRVDLGPAMIAASIPFFIYMTGAGKWTYLGGAAISLTPLAALTIAAGPTEIVNNLFLFPVMYCNRGRHLPLSFVEVPALLLFGLHVGASVVNLAAAFVTLRKSRTVESSLLLSLALFGLLISHQAGQRLDEAHALFAAVCSVSFLPVSAACLFWRKRVTWDWIMGALAVATAMAVVESVIPAQVVSFRRAFIAGLRPQRQRALIVENSGRSMVVDSPETAQSLNQVLSTLQRLALPAQRLFVGPTDLRRTNYNDTYLYFMLPQLKPASYFLEMNPLSANRPGSRLGADIRSADWVVLDRRWDVANEPNLSRSFGSDEPNVIVRTMFEPVGEYGDYVLLRHATEGSSSAEEKK